MAHYNESWDLPPLVGSCYMYGPQQPNPLAWNKLLVERNYLELLELANDALFAAQMRADHVENIQGRNRDLERSIVLIEDAIKAAKVASARG